MPRKSRRHTRSIREEIPKSTNTRIIFPFESYEGIGVFHMKDFNPVYTEAVFTVEELRK